jgi:hypothetical protein
MCQITGLGRESYTQGAGAARRRSAEQGEAWGRGEGRLRLAGKRKTRTSGGMLTLAELSKRDRTVKALTKLVPAGISSSPVRLAFLTSVEATGRSPLRSATGYGLTPNCTGALSALFGGVIHGWQSGQKRSVDHRSMASSTRVGTMKPCPPYFPNPEQSN